MKWSKVFLSIALVMHFGDLSVTAFTPTHTFSKSTIKHLYSTQPSPSSSVPKQEGEECLEDKNDSNTQSVKKHENKLDYESLHFNENTSTSLQKEVDDIIAFAEEALKEAESITEPLSTPIVPDLSDSVSTGIDSDTSELIDTFGTFLLKVGSTIGSTLETTLDATLLSKNDTTASIMANADSLIDPKTIESVKNTVGGIAADINTTMILEVVEDTSKVVRGTVENVMKDIDLDKSVSEVGDFLSSVPKLLGEVVPNIMGQEKDGGALPPFLTDTIEKVKTVTATKSSESSATMDIPESSSETKSMPMEDSQEPSTMISKAAKIGDGVGNAFSMANDIFQSKVGEIQEAYEKAMEEKRLKDEELATEQEFNEALRINRLKARSKSLQLDDRKKIRSSSTSKDHIGFVESVSASASKMLRKEHDLSSTQITEVADSDDTSDTRAEPLKIFPTLGLKPFSTSRKEKKKHVSSQNLPPQGVPILSKWKQNSDNSITGFVCGSSTFSDGQHITTSPIESNVHKTEGGVVTTASGSRYYLEPKKSALKVEKNDEDGSGPGYFRKVMTDISKVTSQETPKNQEPGQDIKPFQQHQTVFWKSPTIFSSAPKGVPTLYDWKVNSDSSVTGFVSNSKLFEEDQEITTSPIRNDVIGGSVIQSKSERYYLKHPRKKIGIQSKDTVKEPSSQETEMNIQSDITVLTHELSDTTKYLENLDTLGEKFSQDSSDSIFNSDDYAVKQQHTDNTHPMDFAEETDNNSETETAGSITS